ncbi:hypothetical protein JW851_05100, partial [Candidatus Woesearchaeota archaeon]|nr:hypothetical protein [Candidatus Woesearchaeota archaeon]
MKKQNLLSKLFLTGAFLGSSLFGCYKAYDYAVKNSTNENIDTRIRLQCFYDKKDLIIPEDIAENDKEVVSEKIDGEEKQDCMPSKENLPLPVDVPVGIIENDKEDFPEKTAGESKPRGMSEKELLLPLDMLENIIKNNQDNEDLPDSQQLDEPECVIEVIEIDNYKKVRNKLFEKKYQEPKNIKKQKDCFSKKVKNNLPGLLFTLLLSCAGAGAYVLFKKRKKIKDTIKFIASLPELSKPGVSEQDVYSFLEKYTSHTPKAILKIFAYNFTELLPDKNEFSKLDLMILSNTVKNNFKYKSDAELGAGISNVVKNYDRSVLTFEDLLDSVKSLRKVSPKLSSASKNIAHILSGLGNGSLFEFRKEYKSLLNKAYADITKENIYSASNYFKEAIICNPKRSEAYFGLADLLAGNHSRANAFEIYTDLIDSNPCDIILSKAFLERAKCYVFVKDYDSALSDLEKVEDNVKEKYGLLKKCGSETGLSSRSIRSFFKKAYYCYLRPAFSY